MNPNPLTRRRYRRTVVLGLALGVALLAAACDGEPQAAEPEPTPATPPTEPADTPEPAPTPEPTPDPTDEPDPEPTFEPPGDPELATTGEDLETVVQSIYAYRSWLFRNPHPDNATERLERITDPDCNCWEPDHTLLTHYAENELWWTGAELQPVGVEVLDRSAPHVAIVGIVFERDGSAELIDRNGQVHDELEPRRFYYEEVLVREDEHSPWRTISTGDERPVPEDYPDEERG